jgi:uncharacterized protein YbcI
MGRQAAQDPFAGAEERPGAIIAAISREIVGFYSRHHGRGPTKAKTVWREGLVVCALEEVFNRTERTLVEAGRFEQVRSNRQAIAETLAPAMCAAIEQQTGRRVESCLSQVSPDDLAVEVFVLAESPSSLAS